MRALALIGLLALVLTACSATAEPAATTSGASAAPEQSQEAATTEPGASETATSSEPTESAEASVAPDGPKTYKVGQAIDVTGDFISSDVRVTVDKVKQAKKYGAYSKPDKGNIYLAVKYTYEALEDGASYNPFDWQVFVDGVAVDNYTFVIDGPTPELHSGTLPKGRKASGWVVYEVPKTGEVILSYGANIFGGEAPTFEVVARAK